MLRSMHTRKKLQKSAGPSKLFSLYFYTPDPETQLILILPLTQLPYYAWFFSLLNLSRVRFRTRGVGEE
ncbi:hypothetical protein IQ07DRAFT_406556 [Pyrenochaeta sp. DS3sAY3a]|nr:hypothetical protein IQ07DRAFT_406556 [Pyrenochaeta sp. DS3sAY3a]